MKNNWKDVAKPIMTNPAFPRLKAYAVSADGTRLGFVEIPRR